ncbi:unnamed protein product [Pipistrellus nathusii]|uniref:Uncharacterized protein n=1 Tax=Pipistrellus nathusii TaxID=59473 RepID=A0ABN9ZCX9_PIPNA
MEGQEQTKRTRLNPPGFCFLAPKADSGAGLAEEGLSGSERQGAYALSPHPGINHFLSSPLLYQNKGMPASCTVRASFPCPLFCSVAVFGHNAGSSWSILHYNLKSKTYNPNPLPNPLPKSHRGREAFQSSHRTFFQRGTAVGSA